jgi:hypothetical protein
MLLIIYYSKAAAALIIGRSIPELANRDSPVFTIGLRLLREIGIEIWGKSAERGHGAERHVRLFCFAAEALLMLVLKVVNRRWWGSIERYRQPIIRLAFGAI